MSTEEDDQKEKTADEAVPDSTPSDEEAQEKVADLALRGEAPGAVTDNPERDVTEEDAENEPAGTPTQLGYKRFLYAAYFAGGIGIAFLGSKMGNLIWMRLAAWKPEIGEPRDDIMMPIAAIVGAGTAYYYWKKAKTRQYAEEVASELSQVTWPSRKEVTNSTTVVIVTTAFATIFFALMDRFWGFVTNLVYGT
jgi:preprotein translocase subunit SecE